MVDLTLTRENDFQTTPSPVLTSVGPKSSKSPSDVSLVNSVLVFFERRPQNSRDEGALKMTFACFVTMFPVVLIFLIDLSCSDHPFIPPNHLPYYHSLKKQDPSTCWGHEPFCEVDLVSRLTCSSNATLKQRQEFYDEADFGYIKEKLNSLQHVCKPELPGDSELLCTGQLQFLCWQGAYG